MNIHLVLPNQLFQDLQLIPYHSIVYLIEEHLFFKHFKFHKEKLRLHRASMKKFEARLSEKGFDVQYVNANEANADLRVLLRFLINKEAVQFSIFDPSDDWIERRIEETLSGTSAKINFLHSPMWLNSRTDLDTFFQPNKKKFFQTQFYIAERKRLSVLTENNESPVGGQWSFDADNRKKYPKNKIAPDFPKVASDVYLEEATEYVLKNFPNNPGDLSETFLYATDFESSKKLLFTFFTERFAEFGDYEDALVEKHETLHHSVLTPMMNIGLLTPDFVLQEALDFAKKNEIPLNSLEGFVRQIMGWREFIRGVYIAKGREERTRNFWNFKRKIPRSFYDGTTGIDPVDNAIKKVVKTGYNHHIERLMVLGNFMLICEFDPDEVYKWFMEMYIDSYDWVMVPNVYGMSQFADGGLMSTKPYFSGSNYLMKMSDFQKGDWQQTWDGLFWRFIAEHKSFFLSNPRLSMMARTWEKMDETKKENHLKNAERFLVSLDKRN